jgi:transcriptional regulator with XRE-family HTH domain
MAGRVWAEGEEITPEQIEELRVRMGLTQAELAQVLEVTLGHVNNLLHGRRPVVKSSTRVLLRWLFAVYDVQGGRPPTPKITVTRIRAAE